MELVSNSIKADYLYFSYKLLRNNNLFWTGFIIYTLSYTISQSTHVNYIVCEIFQLIGLVFLIPTTFNLVKFKFDNKYLQVTFSLFAIWSLFIIIRGFNFSSDFLKQMLFDAYFGLFLYFVPLVLLFPRNISLYKKLITVIVILDVFYIIYDVIFIKDLLNSDYTNLISQGILEQFSKTLSIPNGFILLTFLYHSNKRKVLAIIVSIITLFFAIFRGRRGLVFVYGSILVFSFLFYFIYTKERILTALLGLFVVSILTFKAVQVYQDENGFFSLLTERLDEDTRSTVEMYFYADLTTKDWIIGKGINGQYYCPYLNEDLSGYRYIIETDYLQMILKGGIVSLILILLIMAPAIINGLFFSRNLLSKAAGAWILLWLVYLYPTSVTTFTLHYMLVWICIGICYSKKIRSIPEETMRKYFKTA